MYGNVTVQMLYHDHSISLSLEWLTGQEHVQRCFRREPGEFTSLVGYLNFVHPQQIPVLGRQEFDYLAKLDISHYQDAVNQLFATRPVVIVIADGQRPTQEMLQHANTHNLPMICAKAQAQTVIDHLAHYLNTRLAETLTVHGVFMQVFDLGILLTGASGVGKSELALELIGHGHRLIADDTPLFSRIAPHTLTGSCPPLLQDFLEVRGLGIVNVRAMFGDTAIKDRKQLHLIVNVVDVSDSELRAMDRLHGMHRIRQLLGVDIPEVTLPAAPGRSLAVLVEAAVRNQVLRLSGYNASELFDLRQSKQLSLETL